LVCVANNKSGAAIFLFPSWQYRYFPDRSLLPEMISIEVSGIKNSENPGTALTAQASAILFDCAVLRITGNTWSKRSNILIWITTLKVVFMFLIHIFGQ